MNAPGMLQERLWEGKFLFIFTGFSNRIRSYTVPARGVVRNMKKEPAKRVGDIVAGAIKGLGIEAKIEEGRLRAEWAKIVGAAIAERSRPLRARGGTLLVEVRNSTWMNEIQFHRGEIVRKVRREFPKLKIDDIRLQIERERERE